MKTLLISMMVISVLILSGCTKEQPQLNSLNEKSTTNEVSPAPNIKQEKNAADFTTSYIPDGWVIEENFFYSPEMYNAREGGPYSLHLTINEKFSSIDSYLKDKSNCVADKTEFKTNNYPAVQFTDSCAYGKPKMTITQINENLVEAFSYSFSDESKEIDKILETLEIKK